MTPRLKSAHESFDRDPVQIGSNRNFGFVFFAVFLVIGFFWRDSASGWIWWGAAISILVISLVAPRLLSPFNKAWYLFGMALSRITTPIILGILFFLVVTPTGLIARMFGKDLLRLRVDKATESYWIERRPPGPDPKSMNQQF
jgi:hypothetical protein